MKKMLICEWQNRKISLSRVETLQRESTLGAGGDGVDGSAVNLNQTDGSLFLSLDSNKVSTSDIGNL